MDCATGPTPTIVELGDDRVIDKSRSVENRTAVNYPVPDGDQPAGLQIDTVLGQLLECHPQRRGMVGDKR